LFGRFWKGAVISFSLFLCFVFLCSRSFASSDSLNLKSDSVSLLTDGKEGSYAKISSVTLSCETEIESLYVIYYETPTDFTLSDGETTLTVKQEYLRSFIDVKQLFGNGKKRLVLSFSSETKLLEIYGFAGETPDWVQKWASPTEKADLCLMTTHADDEQLFFAGILPYYAGEKGYEVQVIYFTDHKKTPLRRHELLNGLWTVGVRRYPVISPFPDLYSMNEATAESQMKSNGYDRNALIGFQVEMLRRFRPLVVVGHDPNGEYGHGQHRLNSSTLRQAVQIAGDEAQYPESAKEYGAWDVPKTYLHSYGENSIVMNWDVPLTAFGGKTAFQVSQDGFECHTSQHYAWFYQWLNGTNGEITAASQIDTYSPCAYGLFRSTVGPDEAKNDFFEHVKTWEQQRLEEEEKKRQEEEEQKRREEEERKQREEEQKRREEEERKRREEEEKRLREEEQKRLEQAAKEAEKLRKEKEQRDLLILICVTGILFTLIFGIWIFRRRRSRF